MSQKFFDSSAFSHNIARLYNEKQRSLSFINESYSRPSIFEDDFDINVIEFCNRVENIENKTIEKELHLMEYTVKQINLSKAIKKSIQLTLDNV